MELDDIEIQDPADPLYDEFAMISNLMNKISTENTERSQNVVSDIIIIDSDSDSEEYTSNNQKYAVVDNDDKMQSFTKNLETKNTYSYPLQNNTSTNSSNSDNSSSFASHKGKPLQQNQNHQQGKRREEEQLLQPPKCTPCAKTKLKTEDQQKKQQQQLSTVLQSFSPQFLPALPPTLQRPLSPKPNVYLEQQLHMPHGNEQLRFPELLKHLLQHPQESHKQQQQHSHLQSVSNPIESHGYKHEYHQHLQRKKLELEKKQQQLYKNQMEKAENNHLLSTQQYLQYQRQPQCVLQQCLPQHNHQQGQLQEHSQGIQTLQEQHVNQQVNLQNQQYLQGQIGYHLQKNTEYQMEKGLGTQESGATVVPSYISSEPFSLSQVPAQMLSIMRPESQSHSQSKSQSQLQSHSQLRSQILPAIQLQGSTQMHSLTSSQSQLKNHSQLFSQVQPTPQPQPQQHKQNSGANYNRNAHDGQNMRMYYPTQQNNHLPVQLQGVNLQQQLSQQTFIERQKEQPNIDYESHQESLKKILQYQEQFQYQPSQEQGYLHKPNIQTPMLDWLQSVQTHQQNVQPQHVQQQQQLVQHQCHVQQVQQQQVQQQSQQQHIQQQLQQQHIQQQPQQQHIQLQHIQQQPQQQHIQQQHIQQQPQQQHIQQHVQPQQQHIHQQQVQPQQQPQQQHIQQQPQQQYVQQHIQLHVQPQQQHIQQQHVQPQQQHIHQQHVQPQQEHRVEPQEQHVKPQQKHLQSQDQHVQPQQTLQPQQLQLTVQLPNIHPTHDTLVQQQSVNKNVISQRRKSGADNGSPQNIQVTPMIMISQQEKHVQVGVHVQEKKVQLSLQTGKDKSLVQVQNEKVHVSISENQQSQIVEDHHNNLKMKLTKTVVDGQEKEDTWKIQKLNEEEQKKKEKDHLQHVQLKFQKDIVRKRKTPGPKYGANCNNGNTNIQSEKVKSAFIHHYGPTPSGLANTNQNNKNDLPLKTSSISSTSTISIRKTATETTTLTKSTASTITQKKTPETKPETTTYWPPPQLNLSPGSVQSSDNSPPDQCTRSGGDRSTDTPPTKGKGYNNLCFYM